MTPKYFVNLTFTIRFLVQINLPVQYLKHLPGFLATLCCFGVFWGILQSFLGIYDINDRPKKLEFNKCDLTIKFLVQAKLSIQY